MPQGADNTRSFSAKETDLLERIWSWAIGSILRSLANLDKDEKPDKETLDGIEQFVCQLYQPKATIKTVKELRWSLFKKRQAESDKLPPAEAALHQAILRGRYQLIVWNNDCVPNPVLPSTRGYHWIMENDEWIPVMTTLTRFEGFLKCRCTKERCSTNHCPCRNEGCAMHGPLQLFQWWWWWMWESEGGDVTMMTAILRMKRMMMMR